MDQLRPHLPEGHFVRDAPAMFTFPGQERGYGPDVYVAARRAFRARSEQYVDGEALSLVADLASPPTFTEDLQDKVQDFGAAGVPVYLLIDIPQESATVLSDPGPRGYRVHNRVPFGKKLRIPAPFDCDLDTSDFDVPPEDEAD